MYNQRSTEQSRSTHSPRHRSAASFTTNASGIADSTLSFVSYATGEEPLRLSQFPRPPSASSSPGGTLRTSTPTLPMPPPDMRPVHPLNLQRNGDAHDYVDTAGPPSYDSHQRDQIIPSQPHASPTARVPRRLPVPPSSTSSHALSSNWYEGSSAIAVDSTEERLLSTALITHLLSETESSSSSDSAIDIPWDIRLPRDQPIPSPPLRSDNTSAISGVSDMTYPPPLRRTAYSANIAPSRLVTLSNYGQGSQSFSQGVSEAEGYTSSNYTADGSMPLRNDVSRMVFSGRPESISIRSSTFAGTFSDHRQSVTSSTAPLNPNLGRITAMSTSRGSRRLDLPENVAGPSSMQSSAVLPSSLGTRNMFSKGNHRHRQSFHSSKTTKSVVSSLISKISSSSGARSIKQSWRKAKPLPPVPMLPDYTIAQEREWRRMEESLPLPDLVNRADNLSRMLEKGHRPHRSESSLPTKTNDSIRPHSAGDLAAEEYPDCQGTSGARTTGFWHMYRSIKHQRNRTVDYAELHQSMDSPKSQLLRTPKKSRGRHFIGAGIIIVIAIIVSVVAGITSNRKSSATICSGNLTGSTCQLDATCVCTSIQSGQCNGLAQALISLLPVLETSFNASFTSSSLYTAIWQAHGDVSGSNCASQANLIDVGSVLDARTLPNRTQWTQAALLWNLAESQNLTAVSSMRKFVQSCSWSTLGSSDGPVSGISSKFSTQVSGYVFDFAAQTVTPPSVSFVNAGQPSSEQISRVSTPSSAALDRMYSFAVASSTQRQKALSYYWQTVLQRKPSDLSSFLSAFVSAPILIPFDASSRPLAALLEDTSAISFPPPLACYPNMTSTQMQNITAVETSVFGLSSPSPASKFDSSCYPDRPVYGVLDVLSLRLPFLDSRIGVPRQAAILQRDTLPRAIFHSGEILSALPGSVPPSNISSVTTDPRRFGTSNNINHIALDYLLSMPDTSVANSVIDFVLQTSAVPPPSSSSLLQSLSSIPAIEVAVFGSIEPTADIAHVVSSFSTPLGSLFFGSDQGAALRNWAINITSSSIAWTDTASALEVVHETSSSEELFQSVWDPAYLFLHTSNPSGPVDVDNITQSFQLTGQFSA